jgi:hypothetical protein
LGIAAGGLLALGLLGSLALRAYGRMRLRAASTALAERGGSLALASYELPDIPPAENAATWLEAGASVVIWDRKSDVAIRGYRGVTSLRAAAAMPWASWDAVTLQAVRAALVQNEGALAILHRAADKPRSSFGISYREGKRARVPSLYKLRTATTLLLLEARLAARQGDREGILSAVRTIRRCVDSASAEPMLLMVLVGTAIEDDLLGLVADLATSTEPRIADPQFLRRLAAELPEGDRLAQLRRSMLLDAAVTADAFRVGDPTPVERILIFPFQELAQAAVVEHTLQSLEVTKTPVGGRPDPPDIKPSVLMFHQRLAWLVEVSPRVVRQAQAVMAQRQLVSTALRLRALALEGTGYPDVLPASMGEPNPFTGVPLEYARQGDGSVKLAIPGISSAHTSEFPRDVQRRTLALPAGPRL